MKRSIGMIVFEVSGANLNGSPDWDNQPRTLSDGRGWASKMSMTRKLRDMLVDHDSPIFKDLMGLTKIKPNALDIYESSLKGMDTKDPMMAIRMANALGVKDTEAFLDKYWDIRVFGTTALEATTNKDEDGQEKGKGKGFRFKRTGPASFCPAISIAPIEIVESTITKRYPQRQELVDAGNGDIAPMALKFVRHGLYAMRFGINPNDAKHTRTTQQDIDLLKVMLPYIFSSSPSVSRPIGSIQILHVWWADHENSLGSFSDFEFFKQLTPKKKVDPESPSAALDEYTIPTAVNIKGVKIVDLMK